MPNRILKESICTSDSINELDWFSEVLFYRLIVNCDDFGRFDGRTAVIKNRLFPLKESITLKNVETAINKLAFVGLAVPYQSGGKPFLFLPTWNEHQIIRAKKSKYPEPEIICNQMQADENKCPRNPIQSESNPNTNPNTESGMRAGAQTPAAIVQADFLNRINATPSPSSLDALAHYAEQMGVDVCKRAFDIALDNKKTSWSYIRAILADKLSRGVKCLADWDELDKKHEQEKKVQPRGNKNPSSMVGMNLQPSEERIQKSTDFLEKFLAEQGVKID